MFLFVCVYIYEFDQTKFRDFKMLDKRIRDSKTCRKKTETPRQKKHLPNVTSRHNTKTAEISRHNTKTDFETVISRPLQNFPRTTILKVPFATPSILRLHNEPPPHWALWRCFSRKKGDVIQARTFHVIINVQFSLSKIGRLLQQGVAVSFISLITTG